MISLINLQFAYHINPKNLLYLELGSEQKAGISIYNKKIFTYVQVITFPVSHRRREMYSGHARLSVATRRNYCMDPDVT